MIPRIAGTAWRFAVFTLVCLFGLFALVMVFGEIRFQKEVAYRAVFANVTGLQKGNFVRIAGVEVGKVKDIEMTPDATMVVTFTTDPTVPITGGTKAIIRYDDLIGGRYLALQEGAGDMRRLNPGDTIALDRTAPALDLDALIGGFRPLFRALDPEQVNALSGQLIHALQGQGPTINSFLRQTASLTEKLADRDRLVDEVITNLNTVLGTVAEQNDQFDKGVAAVSELVDALAERRADLSTGLGHMNDAAAGVAELLAATRAPLIDTVAQADRTAAIVVTDHEYVEDLIDTLPDSYRALARQGIYGDFFSFYLCDLVLKMNGKGGQPVYIKLAGQSSGRCAPR
ncbi:MCE family protein [Mycolicibacterium vaccae]|uniref:MCE family protein n=1 Tax=Mycolicibacterium vaccae TaxID=1810 RepID=UPI003CECDF86